MYIVDTHTHIYLPEFDDDRGEIMARAKAAGVDCMILPAIDASTHGAMMEVEKNYKGCLSMIGLHPCSVNGGFEKEIDIIRSWLEQRKFAAIGETGLDFYWDKTFVEQQYASFRMQARMALEYGLPLVIHSREAIDECIGVVQEFPGLKGVFHCFSGNEDQARRIMETGFFLGIGGVVTFKNAGLDKVVSNTGLSRVILETDAPYLAPVPHRGKRNEPAYLQLVTAKLAELLGKSVEEVVKLTTENAVNLFKLGQ